MGLPQSAAKSSQVGLLCSIRATRWTRSQCLIAFSRGWPTIALRNCGFTSDTFIPPCSLCPLW